MCAQYDEQIDSEIQINAQSDSSAKSKRSNGLSRPTPAKGTPPQSLLLTNVHTSDYEEPAAVSPPISHITGRQC